MLQSQSSTFSKASPLVHDAMLAEEDQRQQKFKHKIKMSLKVTSNSFSWLMQSCKNIKLSWSKNWPLGFVSTVLQTSLLQWCFMGKMLLRPQGNFLAQYHKWPHGKIGSRAECHSYIHVDFRSVTTAFFFASFFFSLSIGRSLTNF